MTEGLLNSPFHDKSNGDRRRDLDEFRSQLADAVFVEVGKVAGKALQAANLPLFKRSALGLEQVVRLRLMGMVAQHPSGVEPAETLSVSFEGTSREAGPVRFEDERGIGVVELARNREHLDVVEAVGVQHDTRRIAGEGRACEGIDLMNLDTAHHHFIPRPHPKGGRF